MSVRPNDNRIKFGGKAEAFEHREKIITPAWCEPVKWLLRLIGTDYWADRDLSVGKHEGGYVSRIRVPTDQDAFLSVHILGSESSLLNTYHVDQFGASYGGQFIGPATAPRF